MAIMNGKTSASDCGNSDDIEMKPDKSNSNFVIPKNRAIRRAASCERCSDIDRSVQFSDRSVPKSFSRNGSVAKKSSSFVNGKEAFDGHSHNSESDSGMDDWGCSVLSHAKNGHIARGDVRKDRSHLRHKNSDIFNSGDVSQVRRRNGAARCDSKSDGEDGCSNENSRHFWGVQNGDHTTNSHHCKSCEAEKVVAKTEFSTERSDLFSRTHVYLKRSLSNALPDWLTEPEYMVHARPRINKTLVHHHADSLFSTSSGFTNYYGILNLCLILLVLGNARLFLENIIKYGILINFTFTEWLFLDPYNWPNLTLTCSLVIYPTVALLTELLLAKSFISNRSGCIIYIFNLGCLLVIPAGVIYYLHPVIVFSLMTLGTTTICFLKLISYGHTNYWCREQRYGFGKRKRRKSFSSTGEQTTVVNSVKEYQQVYPDNLNVKDMVYFLFAPTLCYELNFPRSARVRKRFLLKRILEMMFLSSLNLGLLQQWIVPAVQNSRQPLAEMEVFKMMERLLKLAVPNHFIWLIFFYWFFHSTLNVIAELLRFADREFYKDWWNAEGVAEFWQNWNIPVHRFAIRHVYKPLLRRGTSKVVASIVVFLLSAFFHEYLVSVPLRMFKIWAFSGMLMQVPMAFVTARYVRGKWGNIFMWLTLILGQPVAILAYFHDYYVVGARPFMEGNATSSGL